MERVLEKLTFEFFGKGQHKISPEAFFDLDAGVFLDVRAEEEVDTLTFRLEHHDNIEVLCIPLDQLPARLGEVPKGKPIAVFCSAGVRSAIAYAYLLEKGFSGARILEGGYAPIVDALKPGKLLEVLRGRD